MRQRTESVKAGRTRARRTPKQLDPAEHWKAEQAIHERERHQLEGRPPATQEEAARVATAMSLLLSSNSPRGSKPDERILAAFVEWWKVHRSSNKAKKEPSRRELANKYLGRFESEKERRAAVENLKKMIQYYCRKERKSDLLGDKIAQLLEFQHTEGK